MVATAQSHEPRRITLEQLSVASPCNARWEEMTGDARRRLCAECGLHVHNVSQMSRDEAERFLSEVVASVASGKRVCVRMYRRADGTVLTKNCPVGLAAIRHRAWAGMRRVAAVLSLGVVALFVMRREEAKAAEIASQRWPALETACRSVRPFSWVSERLGKERPRVLRRMIMGDVCIPPSPSPLEHAQNLGVLPTGEARQ